MAGHVVLSCNDYLQFRAVKLLQEAVEPGWCAHCCPSGAQPGISPLSQDALRSILCCDRDSSNPMDNVSFFDFPDSTEKKVIEGRDWSCMMPSYNRVRSLCRSGSVL